MIEDGQVYYMVVHFNGRVQGVGFRYKVSMMAREFELSGIVENLTDGRVRLEAEGDEENVRSFIARVCDNLAVFIRGVEKESGFRDRALSGFKIG